MAINNINSWERWGFLTGLRFVVSRWNAAKKDSRSEERERAEEWEIQRKGKTERAGCDLNPRLGKKESHTLWNMHTHNTHIWSIQFLLPISEDKYDGCKLHTVNLVFHIVYMRWVSTPVNYSADYSELPFINGGCGCLVGLIHESSPPSRVISRLFGFFCEHVREATTFTFWIYHHIAGNLSKFSQANVLMASNKSHHRRTLSEQHAEGCLAPLCLLPCMQATTCRISPPEHHFRLLSQVKAACALLETVQILLLTPQLCPKKKKKKKACRDGFAFCLIK